MYPDMKHLLIVLLVFVAQATFASRPPVIPFTAEMVDGRTLTYYLAGNGECLVKRATTGEILLPAGDKYRVATAAERAAIKARFDSIEAMRAKALQPIRTRAGETLPQGVMPRTGSPKVIAILVDFPDRPATKTAAELKQVFDGDTYFDYIKEDGNGWTDGYYYTNRGSVRQYYADCSGGQFTPRFDVVGPFRLPKNASEYINNTGDHSALRDPALNAADTAVDFKQYDLIVVIAAGHCYQYTGNDNDISASLRWGGAFTRDGKAFQGYIGYSELAGGSNMTYTTSVGTMCHEMGHAIGLPDLYPTDYSWLVAGTQDYDPAAYNNQSMEYWDLMDMGDKLNNGFCPLPVSSFERWLLGWAPAPETVAAGASYTLAPQQVGEAAEQMTNAMRVVNPADNNEYWVLDNLQRYRIPNAGAKGWYQFAPADGMLATHIRYNASRFDLNGTPPNNTKNDPLCTVLPADGMLASTILTGNENEQYRMTSANVRKNMETDTYPLKDAKYRLCYGTVTSKWPAEQTLNVNSIVDGAWKAHTASSEIPSLYSIARDGENITFTTIAPTSAIAGVAEAATTPTAVYDLTGRRINGRPHTGLYIVGGKVVSVK